MKMNMFKRILALTLGILMCISMVACGSSEEEPQGTTDVGAGADESTVPDIPETTDTEVPKEKGPVPEVPLGDKTVVLSSAEMLKLIESGNIAENGDYAVTDGEYLTFARAHNEKVFDLKGALIRIGVREGEAGFIIKSRTVTLKNALIAVYGGTAVSVASDNSTATLSGIHVGGDAYAGFDLGGSDSTLDACTVKPSEGGTIETGVIVTGKNAMVTNCAIEGTDVGVTDASSTGALVQNNVFTNCEIGVLAKTANTQVLNNTVNGGSVGIKAAADKAEISAVMCDVYNVIAAKNKITGAEKGILFDKVSNCVALMNETDDLWVTGCINAYVINNRVSDSLVVKSNNYIIADSNTRGNFQYSDNSNTNGGDLTDLNERAAVGVNQKLLPHINREQFAGMVGRTSFRSKYGTLSMRDYINAAIAAGDKEIIVPPGAHNNAAMSFSGLSDVKMYGYGVYNDTIKSTATAMAFTSCNRVELHGFFIGNSINPNLQGTVISVTGTAGKETIKFVADPGYLTDYTDSSDFPATNGGGGCIYEKGVSYPYSEIWYEHSSKTYDPTTQINTVKLTAEGIKYGRLPYAGIEANPLAVGSIDVGDRVALRNYKGAAGIATSKCSEMKIEDVTVFNCSGFALSDYDSDVAAALHRYAVTSGPAPVLDSLVSTEVAKVNDHNKHVTWTDSYGRLRSAFSLNTTCDATHTSSARVGTQAISCLLENMNDDGGNINAHYGTAVSFDSSTKTLTYMHSVVSGNADAWSKLPGDFRVGDKLLLFTNGGEFIIEANVTQATKTVGTDRYAVVIDASVTLPSDAQSVIVQNASACGNNFLWDNVMVRNTNSYGVRIQARDGEIKNCHFEGLEKGGVSMIPQYVSWPECGYASNVTIKNNIFKELSPIAAQWYAWDSKTDGGIYMPICISAPGTATSDVNYCMFRNITISGNLFESRYSYFDISVKAVQNLSITGNTFRGRKGMESTDTQPSIVIHSGNGITVNGNTFTNSASSNVRVNNSSAVAGLSGNNVD